MRKKIIVCLLSFIICFTSISPSFVYADSSNSRLSPGIVMGGGIVATLVTVAVASGITIDSDSQIIDLANGFYHNYKDNYSMIEDIFKASVVFGANKVVSVGKDFLDLCKDFFDTVSGKNIGYAQIGNYSGLPIMLSSLKNATGGILVMPGYNGTFGKFTITRTSSKFSVLNNITGSPYSLTLDASKKMYIYATLTSYNVPFLRGVLDHGTRLEHFVYGDVVSEYDSSICYYPETSSYDWDNNISANVKNDKLDVYVPGNAGSLVGVGSSDVVYNPSLNPSLNPPYELPTDGVVDFPLVENPSVDIDKDSAIPNDGVSNPDIPSNPDVPFFPPFPSFGDSLDFSPMYLSGITEKFPFSLPWDVGRILDKFDVSPVAPKFEFPILGESLVIDLTIFDEWANIGRFFVLIGFVVFLIFTSTRLKG